MALNNSPDIHAIITLQEDIGLMSLIVIVAAAPPKSIAVILMRAFEAFVLIFNNTDTEQSITDSD